MRRLPRRFRSDGSVFTGHRAGQTRSGFASGDGVPMWPRLEHLVSGGASGRLRLPGRGVALRCGSIVRTTSAEPESVRTTMMPPSSVWIGHRPLAVTDRGFSLRWTPPGPRPAVGILGLSDSLTPSSRAARRAASPGSIPQRASPDARRNRPQLTGGGLPLFPIRSRPRSRSLRPTAARGCVGR